MSAAPKPLKALASLTHFDAWVLTTSEALHVLLCGAAWDEASKQGGAMDALLGALSSAHPALHVARVDCEEVGEVAEQFALTMVPTFLLFRGKALVARVEGPDAAAVTQRVEALAAAPAQQPAAAAAVPASLVALRARVERLVAAAPVMAFIKGSPAEPKCKFSRRLLEILTGAAVPFGSFDVLSDEAVRQDLKEFSQWPTYPQIFVGGKLVGGIDIVQELKDGGELLSTLLPGGAAAGAGGAAAAADAAAAPAAHAPASSSAAAGAAAAAPAPAPASGDPQARLLRLVHSAPVVLLMKGTPEAPACGFSERAVAMLRQGGVAFTPCDVLSDSGVREAAKALFEFPSFPMVLAQGKLVGGCDALREMTEAAAAAAAAGDGSGGTLAAQLGVTAAEPLADRLARITSSARTLLVMKGSPTAPQCGFSRQAVQLLSSAGAEMAGARDASEAAAGQAAYALGALAYFDILRDQDVREGLKQREAWPTYPMLFHNGKLLGGLDIMRDMGSELADALKE